MLGRALLTLSALDPGMNVRNVLIARMAVSPGRFARPGTRATWEDVLERARRVPGVESAAMSDTSRCARVNDSGTRMRPRCRREGMPIALATGVDTGLSEGDGHSVCVRGGISTNAIGWAASP